MVQNMLKEVIGFLFRSSGIGFVIRQVCCKKRATIVVYHDPQPERFRKHLQHLSRHYHFIPLTRLVAALERRDWSGIPDSALVVTLDDGHKGNFKLTEIFREFALRPTIFVCSHIVNTSRHFWWTQRNRKGRKSKEVPSHPMLRSSQAEENYEPEKEYPDRQALSLSEMKEMLPYVEFGSHTKFHRSLPNCRDQRSRDEVMNSKEHLEQLMGKPVVHFCFPEGHYSSRELKYIKESGYKSARTLDVGWNDVKSDPYRLKAMAVEDHASINVLSGQVCGFFGYIRYLLRRTLPAGRQGFKGAVH